MSEQMAAGWKGPARGGFIKRALKVLSVLAGMAIAAAIGLYVTLLLAIRGEEIVVPNLVSMPKDEAENVLRAKRLTLEVVSTRVDRGTGAGRVLEQEPAAGARTKPNRMIRVVVSLGEETLEMPSFVGEPIRKVELTLKRMDLRVGHLAHAPWDGAPADQVIAQRPLPGARRQRGEAVDLLVSRGPRGRVYVMPALRGLSTERAARLLQGGGLRAEVTQREVKGSFQSGLVLEQQPEEGFPIRERETVRLVVSQ